MQNDWCHSVSLIKASKILEKEWEVSGENENAR